MPEAPWDIGSSFPARPASSPAAIMACRLKTLSLGSHRRASTNERSGRQPLGDAGNVERMAMSLVWRFANLDAMDLSVEYPRSPRERLAGLDLLARTIDLARAQLAGTLGDYT